MYLLTVLSGEDPDHLAERAFAPSVVNPHFHLELGLRRHAVVAVNVSGGVGRRQGRLYPGGAAERPERHHVAEVFAGVLLLWNRLRAAGRNVAEGKFLICVLSSERHQQLLKEEINPSVKKKIEVFYTVLHQLCISAL